MENRIKEYFKEWNLFEKIWLLVFTIVNLYLFFAWHDTLIGLTASLTGMLCVVLTAKGRISSFYWGLINIFTYSWVAFRSAYYGDVQLNLLYFLPMTFVGIYYWKKNQRNNKAKADIVVKKLKWSAKIFWFFVCLIITAIYGYYLSTINDTLPYIDASTNVFSIIATILLNKRLVDQWFYWIMVDVLSIVMWAFIFVTRGSDVTVLIMWAAFLTNALYGYYNWRRLEKSQNGK